MVHHTHLHGPLTCGARSRNKNVCWEVYKRFSGFQNAEKKTRGAKLREILNFSLFVNTVVIAPKSRFHLEAQIPKQL